MNEQNRLSERETRTESLKPRTLSYKDDQKEKPVYKRKKSTVTTRLDNDINIYISETNFKDLKHHHKKYIRKKFLRRFGFSKQMDEEEFHLGVTILYKCCLRGVKDLHELHQRRLMGLKILEELILRAKPEYLTIPHVIHIMWSIMSCIHHFQLRVKTDTAGIVSWARKRQANHCLTIYTKLLKLIKESKQRIALNAILTFYREGKLWEIEFGCTDMIIRLFELRAYADEGIDDIIFSIEYATTHDNEDARYLMQILYKVVKQIRWPRIPEYLLVKFLDMIVSSISPQETDLYNYVSLKKGLEICFRNTINNLSRSDLVKTLYLTIKKINENSDDQKIFLCLGNICAYAAEKYKQKSSKIPLARGPLPIILTLFETSNPVKLLVGLKIWQHLVDKNNNSEHFLSPIVFFQECDYNIVSSTCSQHDKAFFKKVRHFIYEITIKSFMRMKDKIGLENVYQSVALTLVTVPCGYTASCFVTVAMSVQDFALRLSSEDLVRSHHLHATVLSILFLTCYIHKAEIFYNYVLSIMDKRAEWAPHLNPPLKSHYEYAQHHILWNKPELFFEDWEARYGLWKCFRGKNLKN